jgi:hypothetical protein
MVGRVYHGVALNDSSLDRYFPEAVARGSPQLRDADVGDPRLGQGRGEAVDFLGHAQGHRAPDL